jgi:hypothetical protein
MSVDGASKAGQPAACRQIALDANTAVIDILDSFRLTAT